MKEMTMVELLTAMIRGIVETPDKVVVHSNEENGRVILEIECAPSERGLVVGKQGRNIQAIRTIMRIKAVKSRVYVDVRLHGDPPPR